jgi:hypothetical protein
MNVHAEPKLIEFVPPGEGKNAAVAELPQMTREEHFNELASRDDLIPIEAIPIRRMSWAIQN